MFVQWEIQLFLNKSIRTGTERNPSRKTFPSPRRTLKMHHHVNNQPGDFSFLLPTQTPSHTPPSLPDVDTVVHTHPKVSFRLKTHCKLMVRIDPDPTSPKDNRTIRHHETREITLEWVSLGPPNFFVTQFFWDFWIITPSTQSNLFPRLICFFYLETHKVSTSIRGGFHILLHKTFLEQVHSARLSCKADTRPLNEFEKVRIWPKIE